MLKRIYFSSLAISLFILVSCSKQADNYLYEVQQIGAFAPGATKDKQKTIEQYVAILHANLFQKAISASEMVEIRKVIQSIGDKEIAFEVVVSNFMNRPDVIVPADADMRADIDKFLEESYQRFFIRPPTQAEKAWMRNFIESKPTVSAELVYMSLALSEEYKFY